MINKAVYSLYAHPNPDGVGPSPSVSQIITRLLQVTALLLSLINTEKFAIKETHEQ